MNAIARFDGFVRQAVNGASALVLLVVVVLGIAQVISRYFFGASLIWSEELIRLLYVWMILIAAANAEHMRITFLDDALSPRTLALAQLARTVIVLAMLALLIFGAWQLNASFGRDRYVALGISKSWYWMAGVIGCLLWAATQVLGLLRTFFSPVEEK